MHQPGSASSKRRDAGASFGAFALKILSICVPTVGQETFFLYLCLLLAGPTKAVATAHVEVEKLPNTPCARYKLYCLTELVNVGKSACYWPSTS